MDKDIANQYRKEVWHKAIFKARERYDAGVETVRTFLSALLAILGIMILVWIGLWSNSNSIPVYIWGLFGANVISIVATYLAVPIVAYFDMWNIAAEMHNAQETDKERLQKMVEGGPVLRIKKYGNERKEVHTRFENILVGDYDTLYIDVVNKQTRGVAERVWSNIEWIRRGRPVLSHHGRWHIATDTTMNETGKENLRHRNLGSNQPAERLYFAWTHNDGREDGFHGLERDMDGNDSFGTKRYLLTGKEFIVRITLQGNDGVHQEFMYAVKNINGKIFIEKALTHDSQQDESLRA